MLLATIAAALAGAVACRSRVPEAGAVAAAPVGGDDAGARGATDAGATRAAAAADPSDPTDPAAPCDGRAAPLARGVTVERWPVDGAPAIAGAAPCLDLVRVDLSENDVRILAGAREGGARPAPRWVDDFGLVAAINLGMFMDDGRPVALAVDARGEVNGHDNPKYGGFLAFDPRGKRDAGAAVFGRSCDGFDLAAIRRRFDGVVQGYRLLDCDGHAIAWKDEKAYSAAAVGVDRGGRLVLVHARAPYTMKQLSAALARPELALTGAIFVEGGPEASLVVHGDRTLERMGSFETGFVETDDNRRFWDLPNVLGVVPRRR